jgi:hypothetical protein
MKEGTLRNLNRRNLFKSSILGIFSLYFPLYRFPAKVAQDATIPVIKNDTVPRLVGWCYSDTIKTKKDTRDILYLMLEDINEGHLTERTNNERS